jgi:hypothetical protein
MNRELAFMQKQTKPADVILLDYVQTLVANQHERPQFFKRGQPYTCWIEREQYREWLVGLLRDTSATVVLITARSSKYQNATLERMEQQLGGWMPAAAYFNVANEQPPQAKRRALHEDIFSRYGDPCDTAYLALESNRQTRAMYARESIHATPVPYGGDCWDSLPEVPWNENP